MGHCITAGVGFMDGYRSVSARARYASNAFALASASMFLTFLPCITSRTASSESCRRWCAECRAPARSSPARGAAWCWRGSACGSFTQGVVEFEPSRRRTNRTTRSSSSPFLADGDRFQHFGDLLHLPVDFGGADAHAAGIEGGVRAAVDDDAVVLGDLHVVAVAPYAGELARNTRRDTSRRRDRSRTPPASTGTARCRPSSPGLAAHRLARVVETSTFMPRPRHCNSPRQTGSSGLPSAKQEMMSVPPGYRRQQHALLDSR